MDERKGGGRLRKEAGTFSRWWNIVISGAQPRMKGRGGSLAAVTRAKESGKLGFTDRMRVYLGKRTRISHFRWENRSWGEAVLQGTG